MGQALDELLDNMRNDDDRRFEMSKPDGFVPEVQRYSARFPGDLAALRVLHVGVQSEHDDEAACTDALRGLNGLLASGDGPVHFDHAKFVDPGGYLTLFAVAYWRDSDAYGRWKCSEPVTQWLDDRAGAPGKLGYFLEAMSVPVGYAETIAFKELIRGLSACPMSRIEAMGESGYWGSARDRIAASANDHMDSPVEGRPKPDFNRDTLGRRLFITPPKNFTVIRSGVSWEACGEEQRISYEKNILPKLDAGMEYLRNNPGDTGCYAIRQSQSIADDGGRMPESFVVGFFRSLEELETWAKQHPTHLAIFNRAMMERQKYGDALELRTYHEVFVLADDSSLFEYINCHPGTGLLPYFDSRETR